MRSCFRLDVHGAGDLAAHAATPCVPQRRVNCLLAGVIARGRRARLERGDHQALVDQFDAHHMRCVLEGALERGLLLAVGIGRRAPVEADIAGRFRPKLRRAGCCRRARIGHGVERLVIDRDFFAGVLRRLRAHRDHHRHRLADMQHAACSQRRPMRRDRHLAAAAGDRMRMRNRMIMRLCQIGGGQHRHHAGRALGGCHVDVLDFGEGVRRAHEIGGQCARGLAVIAETPGAAQQRVVFDAPGPCGWAGLASGSQFHDDTPAARKF